MWGEGFCRGGEDGEEERFEVVDGTGEGGGGGFVVI